MRGRVEAPARAGRSEGGRSEGFGAGLPLVLLATHRLRRRVPDEVDGAPLAVDTENVKK